MTDSVETVEMVNTRVNNRWDLLLPSFRAERPEWTTGWEVERLESMHHNIHPGDVIYDIGTEEGDISALLASWAAQCLYCGKLWSAYGSGHPPGVCTVCLQPNGTKGGICLFEPNPRVWPCIRAIWEANNLPRPLAWWAGFASALSVLRPHHADITQEAKDGWPLPAYGPMIRAHDFRELAHHTDITPRITLDDFCDLTGHIPDVITMDVEGSEYEVLQGAMHLLRDHQPLVYISMHPEPMRTLYHRSPEDIHRLMRICGYFPGVHLATDHEEHWVWAHRDGRWLK